MPWDPTLRNATEDKSDAQIARIVISRFESGDTKDGTKYSIGGMYVRPIVSYVSKKALAAIGKKSDLVKPGLGVMYDKLKVAKNGVTREHMIPTRVAYEYLKKLYEGNRLTEKRLRRIMPKLCIAIIKKEENQVLVDGGYSRNMPEGWSMDRSFHPLDRYRAAGLKDDIWAREFLDENFLPRYTEGVYLLRQALG